MAEMTAEQVKTLLESFAALCGSSAKAKELCGDAIKFIERQAAEIAKLDTKTVKQSEKIATREVESERMAITQQGLLQEIEKSKRCGNCEHAKEHWDELYGCKFDEDAKFNRRNTCERWELVK